MSSLLSVCLSAGEHREKTCRLTALTTNSALLGHQSQSRGGGGGCGERKGKICELFIEARRAIFLNNSFGCHSRGMPMVGCFFPSTRKDGSN